MEKTKMGFIGNERDTAAYLIGQSFQNLENGNKWNFEYHCSLTIITEVSKLLDNFVNTKWYVEGGLNAINATSYVVYEMLNKYGNESGKKTLEKKIKTWIDDCLRCPNLYGCAITEE